MRSTFLQFRKDSYKFAAGYMTVFPDGTKQRLHGHNFQVGVTLELSAQELIAFTELKQAIMAACSAWDERVLLPRLSPHLEMLPSADSEVNFVLCGDHYVLPARDVVWLDVDFVTTETLAEQFTRTIAPSLAPLCREGRILSVEVQIDKTEWEGASSRMSAAAIVDLDSRTPR